MGRDYSWIKLNKDFFKSAEIQLLESQPNGKEYCLFYLKLMCESIEHNGELRFNELIPYDDQMLATITNTNIDIVRNACIVLNNLKLIDILSDGTLYISEVNKLLNNNKKNKSKNKEIEEEKKEIYIKEKNNNNSYSNPFENMITDNERFTEQEITDYIALKGYNIKAKEFYNYYKGLGWKINNTVIEDIRYIIDNWGIKRMMQERQKELDKKPTQFPQRETSKNAFGTVEISDDEL